MTQQRPCTHDDRSTSTLTQRIAAPRERTGTLLGAGRTVEIQASADLAFHERRDYERNQAERYQGAVPLPNSPKERPALRLVK